MKYMKKKEKAQELFEKLLTYRNHPGLYAEEIDPKTKDFLGNFFQKVIFMSMTILIRKNE